MVFLVEAETARSARPRRVASGYGTRDEAAKFCQEQGWGWLGIIDYPDGRGLGAASILVVILAGSKGTAEYVRRLNVFFSCPNAAVCMEIAAIVNDNWWRHRDHSVTLRELCLLGP
jgi:hypothetical protein